MGYSQAASLSHCTCFNNSSCCRSSSAESSPPPDGCALGVAAKGATQHRRKGEPADVMFPSVLLYPISTKEVDHGRIMLAS